MSSGAIAREGRHGQIVVFLLDDQEFGIEISSVREIVRPQKTTRIPLAPDYFMGLMNLRGGILPVIDTRRRIGVPARGVTDRTRCVVVTVRDYVAGLLVDDVREVLALDAAILEPPPSLTVSMENFIPEVAKYGSGERIVFLLDAEKVMEYGVDLSGGGDFSHPRGSIMEEASREDLAHSLDRFITFQLGEETYAFGIEKISEIIRFRELHSVPEAAPHIKGLINLRGAVVPVFDLRLLMGFEPLVEERRRELEWIKGFFYKRLDEAALCAEKGSEFLRCPDGECILDNWLMGRVETCRSETELNIVQRMLQLHHGFHEKVSSGPPLERDAFLTEIETTRKKADALFSDYEGSLEQCIREEQRILILRHERRPYGLLIDKVDEVLSVPEEELERSHDFAEDIQAVAKLDHGKNLVFILDDTRIVPFEDIEELGEEAEDMEHSERHIETEEIQLVTFNIGEEEYGIPITSVQEINRLQEITRVPRAPSFVEGVTNLRGEVIPMVDLRKRFEIEEKERDDRTRLVIVNIDGKKTGFIVDRVNEVARIQRRNIDPPPALLSAQIDLNFVSGLAKAGEDRMIIILDAEKVLSEEEVQALKDMDRTESPEPLATVLEIME